MGVHRGVSLRCGIPLGSRLPLSPLVSRPCSILIRAGRAAGGSLRAARIFALPLGIAEVGPGLPVPVAAWQAPSHQQLHIPCSIQADRGPGGQGRPNNGILAWPGCRPAVATNLLLPAPATASLN